MSVLSTLVVELEANISGFVSSMQSATGTVDSMSQKLMGAGTAMTGAITNPLIGLAETVLSVGSDYDEVMDGIATKTGATGSTLEGLGETARAVFTSIPTDMETAGQAVALLSQRTDLTRAGLEELAAAQIRLADITGGDLAQQIDSTTRLFGDWGVAVGNEVETLDMLYAASQETGVGVDQLAQRLVQFGAPLRQMGFSIQESTALISKFQAEGVNTELVLGSLRIALGKMAKDGIEPVEGLNTLMEAIKTTGSTAEANQLAIEAFGARAGPDMAAAIREGRFEIDDLTSSLEGVGGLVMETAESTDDYAEKLTLLKNKVIDAAIPLGVTLFDAINNLMPTIERGISFISGLIEKFTALPEPVQTTILAIAGIAAAAGPVLTVIGGIIGTMSSVSGALVGIGGAVAAAVGAIGLSLAPIIVVIGVIIGAVLLFKRAWEENWGGIRDALQPVIDGIKAIIDAFTGWLSGALSFEEFAAKVAQAWDGIKAAIGGVLQALGGIIAEGVANFIAPLVGGIENARQLVSQAWENIRTGAEATWEAIKGIVSGAIEFVRGLVAGLIVLLSGDLSGAWETVKTGALNAWSGIREGISSALQTLGIDVGAKVAEIREQVSSAFETARASAIEKWEAIQSRISTIITGIRDFVVRTLGDLVSKAIELIGKVISAITGRAEEQPAIQLDLGEMIAALRQGRQEWAETQDVIQRSLTEIQAMLSVDLKIMVQLLINTWANIRTITSESMAMLSDDLMLRSSRLQNSMREYLLDMMSDWEIAWGSIFQSTTAQVGALSSAVIGIVSGMRDSIDDILDSAADNARASGEALGRNFADGILSQIDAVRSAARALAEAAGDYLPESDARRGPLSNLSQRGRALVETLTGGIQSASGSLISTMEALARDVDGASPAIAARIWSQLEASGGLAGAGRPANNVTINITNPQPAAADEDIWRQLRNLSALGVLEA